MTQAASVNLVYGIPYNLVTNGLPEGQFTYSFDFALPANTVGRVSGELRSLDVRNSSPGALPHAGLRLSSVRLYDGLGGTGPELADVSLIVVEHREDQGCPFGVPPPCGQVTVNRGTSAPFTDVDVPDQDFSLTFEAVGYSSAFVTGNLTASFRIFVIDAPGLPVGVPLPPGAVLLAVPLAILGYRRAGGAQPSAPAAHTCVPGLRARRLAGAEGGRHASHRPMNTWLLFGANADTTCVAEREQQ